ncbi:MAG: hypothetical protein ABL973_01820 [Micropepsaceae bacterium]
MVEYLQLGYVWLLQFVWRAIPLVATFLLMMLAVAPLNLLQGWVTAPDIALISVFFWAMHGPAFLPPWAVFVIGLTEDFLIGAPLGFWVLLYLFAYGFTLSQRVFFKGRTGIGVWLGFAIVAAINAALAWLLGMLVFERWLSPMEVGSQALVSVLVYPAFARLFAIVRRSLTNAPESL